MKTRYLMILSGCLTILLTGCVKVETMCGYQNDYTHPCYGNGICGPRIRYRCDVYCDQCKANEPACKVCYACLSNEGCAGYYPPISN